MDVKTEPNSDNKPQKSDKKPKCDHMFPVLICALAIPLSMSMWLFNEGFSFFNGSSGFDESNSIHPSRWLIASIISITITIYGLKKKGLTISGAISGFFVGAILTVASYSFLACLFTFFISSTKATKFRGQQKMKLEEDYKEGGQRSWVHVLCNGGMATQLGLLYLLDVGCGERPIHFGKDYRASWLAMGVLGAFACSNGDTWASELGTVLSSEKPFLITTRKRVPKGTNGGITFIGTLLSALGGLVVGFSNYIVVIYFSDKAMLDYSPSQWPIIIVGFLGGFLGSLLDSILGATVQYSGIDETGRIVSSPGSGVKFISGKNILDNHSVNIISTIVMGLLMPYVAMYIWPM